MADREYRAEIRAASLALIASQVDLTRRLFRAPAAKRSFGTRTFDPSGVAAGSQGPRQNVSDRNSKAERQPAATPLGSRKTLAPACRWCRFAQPPANRCDLSRVDCNVPTAL